jgi:DNA-directed RNA polymerase
MEKEQYRESSYGLKISQLCFGVTSALQIRKQSHIECVNKTLYDDGITRINSKTKTAPYGVLDYRLGN